MSKPPATPDKPGKQVVEPSPKSAQASTEKLTSTTKVKQVSRHEPSPASTYGDTTAGSSVPATPEDVGSLAWNENMINMLKATYADPAIESISNSPAGDRQRNSMNSERRAGHHVFATPSSPFGAGVAANVDRNASDNSSQGSDRVRAIRESPNWRPDEDTFVPPARASATTFIHRSGNEADDVFGSLGDISGSPGQGNDPSRQGPLTEPISNDNAQALLPPSACVFVANLTQTQTDDQLEHHVQNAFSQFGICYVKIRRDNNGMPFAFVQYETIEDAQRAITQGRGMHINNRPCRTEVAKVNRSLYLSRVTGGSISEAEARNVLSRYGEIEKVWYSSPTESEIFRLPEGIWVMYKLFQPSRDAQAGFRDHSHYRLEQPPMADDFRTRLRSRPYQSISPLAPRQSPGHVLPSPLRRTTITDLRSVFVGNLPANITEDQLYHMFDIYGPIQHVEIVRKPSANITGINTFAFIEFIFPEAVTAAIQASPRIYGNARLRVERKESTDPAVRVNASVASGGSPRSLYLGDSNDQLAMLYQRGLYAGFAQAAHVQAIPPPIWSGFPYYPSYGTSQYGQFAGVPTVSGDNSASSGMQSQTNSYTTQAAGQFQYPQVSAHYVQFPQQPSRSSYQWPPAGSPPPNAHVPLNASIGETHQA